MRTLPWPRNYVRRMWPFVAGGALTFLAASLAISSVVRKHYADQLRDRLARDAAVLEQALAPVLVRGDTEVDWTELAANWQRILGTRVQLLDSTGDLLGDSESDLNGASSQTMESQGREIGAAIDEGYGWDIRRSENGGTDVLYVARGLGQDGRAAMLVCLSAPLDQLDQHHVQIRRILLWILAGGIMLIVIISTLLSISTTQALARLAQGAAQFSGGDLDARIPVDPYRRADEFAAVAHAFNRAANEVKLRFDQQQRAREQLEAVLSNMNDGLLAVDYTGIVRLVNQTFLRYFRPVFEDPVGHSHTEAFRDHGLNEMIEKTLSGVSGEEGELEVLAPARRVLAVRIALIPDARKNEVRAVLLARDITARRRLQEMRRDFVANVSHELRTPLTAVLGYIEALRDIGPLTPEATGFLDTISRNAERMERIVGDLLELSRIEAPGFSLQLNEFSLRAVAQEVQGSFQGALNQKSQSLSVAVADSADPLVADRDAVARILTNLIENAHKYTPAGGHISVEATREDGAIQLSVRDDGIGVPEADRPRLFERFFRVDRARSRDSGGTGLGLAIVKHLAEAHGGSAHYEVCIPTGSRLVVRLPQPEQAGCQADETGG